MGPYYDMFSVSMTRLNILYKTQINNGGEFLKYSIKILSISWNLYVNLYVYCHWCIKVYKPLSTLSLVCPIK